MEANDIKIKLIEVLQQVQSLSGEECPVLDGDTTPANTLPQFTSKIFPTATGLLSQAIGQEIPCEENIFVDGETREPLDIDQIVTVVCKIIDDQEKEKQELTE